jgi:8-oxo-dGTP diphosphatase
MVEDSGTEHCLSIPSARGSSNALELRTGRKLENFMIVVAGVIERGDRRILIGQRRRGDTSPLKWEFPGGKIEVDEEPVAALARELREELGATLMRCVEMGRVRHVYAGSANPVEIRFYAAEIADESVRPTCFEQIAWVLPKELGDYDFLDANRALIAQLATGKVKPAELLRNARVSD